MNMDAKFGVSSSNRSRHMKGVPKLSRDHFPTPFDPILYFFCQNPWWWIWMQNLAFLAVPEIWRGVPKFQN